MKSMKTRTGLVALAIALPLSDDPTMTRQLRALIERYVD